ncbi:MAG TPA: hypothetical protein PLY23_00265 [Alphaproteobacteria bacterium]|nr:hypothetical protein [Alphaproteobacteria bacterium]HQS93654.1 hypothetical protein [Alphaproteobacteria bacterium]
MIKKILCIAALGTFLFSGNTFGIQETDCPSFKSNTACPMGCIWDCDALNCRFPKCSDYSTNLSCPEQCGWSCSDNACVSSDN